MPGPALTRRRLLSVAAAGLGAAAGAVSTGTQARFAAQQRASTAGAGASTRVLWHVPVEQPLLALTFDDGPSVRYTAQLLDTLRRLQAPATFFVVGEQARAQPVLLRRIVADGHELGNHTDTHPNLGLADLEQCRRELTRCHQTIEKLTGVTPGLFRPPYGAVSGAALRAAAEHGYDMALWTVALREQDLDVAGNVELISRSLQPGLIVLAHDAGPEHRTVGMATVEPIVRAARARGFRLVTVSELLAAAASP